MRAIITQMGVFEGRSGSMVLTARLDLLRQGRYKLAGQLIRWSLAQGGPGLACLAPYHYLKLAGGVIDREDRMAALQDIPDYDVQERVQQVSY